MRSVGELGHAVRDEDQAGRRGHEVAHQLKQGLRLGRGQRSRGLIHDQNLRVEGQRARNFHHLQARNRQVTAVGGGIDVHVEALEQLARITNHLAVVDVSKLGRAGSTDVQVLGDGQVRNDVEFLVDDRQAEVTRVLRRLNVDLLSLQPDLAARVGLVYTGEHLHERGLARSVLTAETQDFTGAKVEVHVGQRLHAGERL